MLVLLLAVGAACGASEPVTIDLGLPSGFSATTFAEGFSGPTQMVFAPNGDLIVAELNGGENDATGRILRVDVDDASIRTVLQENLDKPTGIAVTGDRLWIMERRRLSVAAIAPGAERETVADELPFNGRSEGTLAIDAEGRLLYNTSGSKRGADRVDGSGTIFAIANPEAGAGDPAIVAEGFKHGYATLTDPDGQLWAVEMTDGNFDGERAGDELLAIDVGDDAGWPQCVDDNRPVAEFGGTAASCAASPPSHALLGVGSTPTSFVIAPWDPDVFVIALWLPGEIVTVPRTASPDGPHEPVVFSDALESPQHLVVDGDRILVSDHATGVIYAISES